MWIKACGIFCPVIIARLSTHFNALSVGTIRGWDFWQSKQRKVPLQNVPLMLWDNTGISACNSAHKTRIKRMYGDNE